MTYFIAIFGALLASILTFFTGFGLGTILLPAMVVIFPVAMAVAATAVVHLCNNLFKLFLVAKHARRDIVIRFGVPALIAAFGGAFVLSLMVDLQTLFQYELAGHSARVTPVKLVIGLLMAVFAVIELSRLSEKWVLDSKWMPLGGVLSGFFGGLSGHQGAFRTMFLLKAGLTKEQLIGTGAVIAVIVDIGRIAVYGKQLMGPELTSQASLLAATTVAAIAGSIIGNVLLKKVTLRGVEIAASVSLLLISLLLMGGMI